MMNLFGGGVTAGVASLLLGWQAQVVRGEETTDRIEKSKHLDRLHVLAQSAL